MKICLKCKRELDIINFGKNIFTKDGLNCYCKDCLQIYRDSHKEQKRIYRENHKEESKKHRQEHKKQISKRGKIYYKINRQKILEQAKGYRKSTKGIERMQKYSIDPKHIYFVIKNSAIHRNIEFNLTEEIFNNWYNNQEQKCYYCNRSIQKIKKDIKEDKRYKNRLSIDRKNNNRGYEINNIVLACSRCNIVKGNYFTEQQMLELGKKLYPDLFGG